MTEESSAILTMILRFRDLATGGGETIRRHAEIAEGGFVWWGWWNKFGERIPDDAFRRLALKANQDGLRILLFDSGRLKLFASRCSGITWDPTHIKIATQDPSLTPEYYRDVKYLAWFKLETFEEIDATELQSLTYLRVDEFFAERKSRFDPFYGKRIHGLDELLQQDRTIWFVRPFAPGDPTHKIELLDSAKFSPSDFPSDHIASASRNLIWVSDLHFGDHHGFPIQSSVDQYDLGQAIEMSLTDHKNTDYAGLIVSGDLSWKAKAAEFYQAKQFLHRLSGSPSKLRNYAIVTCPGNHDLAFTKSPQDKSKKIHAKVATKTARQGYSSFYEALFYKQPNEYICCGRRFLLGNCIPVEVASLNSSLLDQKPGWFQGHGFVGDAQLRHAAEQMGWSDSNEPRAFRILVIHHHLIPVTYRDTPSGGYPYSVVLDAEAVSQWVVQHRVDLVLHGHMHHSFIAKVSRPRDGNPAKEWHTFHVAGLSSTGVDDSHADGENAYAVLTFGRHEVQLRWFTVHKKKKSRLQWELSIPFGKEL